MTKILIVDDQKNKVDTLVSLIQKIGQIEIVTPIIPRQIRGYFPDKETVMQFLAQTPDLSVFAAIFQDRNLGDCYGEDLLPIYRGRGYKGPIIAFTASDWEKYKEYIESDKRNGFKDVFPWGKGTNEQEQLEFLRKYLSSS